MASKAPSLILTEGLVHDISAFSCGEDEDVKFNVWYTFYCPVIDDWETDDWNRMTLQQIDLSAAIDNLKELLGLNWTHEDTKPSPIWITRTFPVGAYVLCRVYDMIAEVEGASIRTLTAIIKGLVFDRILDLTDLHHVHNSAQSVEPTEGDWLCS